MVFSALEPCNRLPDETGNAMRCGMFAERTEKSGVIRKRRWAPTRGLGGHYGVYAGTLTRLRLDVKRATEYFTPFAHGR